MSTTSVAAVIDRLIKSNIPFACFRYLDYEDVTFIPDQASLPSSVNVVKATGGVQPKQNFVLSPFDCSAAADDDIAAGGLKIRGPRLSVEEAARLVEALPEPAAETAAADAIRESVSQEQLDKLNAEAKDNYFRAFELFKKELTAGTFKKLVLSRPYYCRAVKSFGKAFETMLQSYPNAYCYVAYVPEHGVFMGASPEKLFTNFITPDDNTLMQTVSLAGTMPARSLTQVSKGNPQAAGPKKLRRRQAQAGTRFVSTLMDERHGAYWSAKNLQEQKLVTDYIVSTLKSSGVNEIIVNDLFTAEAGPVIHLCNGIFFMPESDDLADRPWPIVRALHPTPAVCGLPKQQALEFIRQHEGYARNFYAGIVGHYNGDLSDIEQDRTTCRLFVNLRCLQAKDGIMTLYAGGGLLPASEAESEWQETENKLQTMRSILEDK